MRILSVPMENGLGKTTGTGEAPGVVLEELKKLSERSVNESGEAIEWESEELELELGNLEEANKRIVERCSALFESNERLTLLGGDHSLTYAGFKAFAKRYPNAGLLVFDAHPDLMSAMNPPTHEDYLLTLMSEGILKQRNIMLLGLRSMHSSEVERLKGLRIRQFPMREITHESLGEIMDSAMIIARKWEALYISVDIDAVDPAFAPGTGYPEPGGFTSRELLYCLGRLKLLQNLKAVDLVEVNPRLDIEGSTVRLAAKILSEFC